MEFRILGPLEVIEDGQAIDLGGQKPRALLAVLLLHANEVVSVDRLIEALWPERPPDTAAKALQVYVSQLRKALGKERLLTKAPGYLLRAHEGELDLECCRRLADEGLSGEALALWRGPPLSEFAYEAFAQPEIARLDELMLTCREGRIDTDLAAGRHAAVVGELEGLVAEHPLREGFRAQLMLALYRSARQAEALEVYQSGRRLLADELGLEPGEALKELQRAILAHDSALDLPSPVADEHAPEPPAPTLTESDSREVRKTVTVLSAALAAVDDSESMDPESQRRLAALAFAEISAAVEHHGGTVETVAGETLTAVFGVPAAHEDDALRAVRAAADVRERVAVVRDEVGGWADRLDVRLGASTGEVVTGGAETQLRSTGRPVAAAARLAQNAGPGELLLDAATHRLVKDSVDVEPCETGLRVLEVRAGAVGRRRFDAPIVGRERERRRLHDAFEQAVGDRSCQLFTVLGAAGVGKSRLVREFLAELGGSAAIVGGRCLPYGKGITYYPLMGAVQDAAGLIDADSPEQALAKVAALFEEDEDRAVLARRVGELIGLVDVGVGAQESFGAVRALFESIARRTPLVIVFDDIHWGESTFLDLVEHLADWMRDAPTLIVCVARAELLDVRPGWSGGKLNATSLLLEPLSERESAQLVDSLAGADGLPEETRRRIVDAAEGNPLFVEEMLALMLEGGRDDAEIEVPPTIQALLAARLDRLDGDERAVIEHAAVQGKVFYEEALAASAAVRAVAAGALASLVRKELVRPDRASLGSRAYHFRHLLIRDAAYDSIPKEARAAMHESFGRWLEQAAGDRATEYLEIVGYHLEQAYRYRAELGPVDAAAGELAREAAELLGQAGRRAFVRSDAPAGINLISRAVALLPPDDVLRVELVPSVRVVQGLGADMSWAERVLTEAVEVAATTGDRSLAAHALVQRGLLRLFTAPDVAPDELFDVADRAIAVFEELGDELGLARAWRLVAQAHYLARRVERCAEASQRALEHARRAGDRFEEHEIVEWLVVALFLGPTPAAEAARRCEELLAESAGDTSLQVQILGALALLTAMQGEFERAEEYIARGRRIVEERGEWIWLFSFHVAYVALWEGKPEAAEAELRPPYEALKKLGEKSHFSTMVQYLAVAVYNQGRYDEAEQLSRECEQATRPNDVHSEIMWRSTRAKVLARRGEIDEALALSREAIAVAADSDFIVGHAEALEDMAEVLQLAGRPGEAASTLDEALRLYDRKGNVVAATGVRTRLEVP